MTSAFEHATALQADGTSFRAVIPDGWQQGKGAFGGVVVGIMTRAMLASEADRTRTLRSVTADLCAPLLEGDARVHVTTLRRGTSMTFLDARLEQAGALVARASVALGTPRSVVPPALRSPAPAMPPWSDVAVVPVGPPFGPIFTRHYEYRVTGPMPFSGGTEASVAGWLREKVTPDVLDAAAIAGMLDAWWPTSFSTESAPRAVATVGYTMQLLVDPARLPVTEPLFYRAHGVASADNFFVEMRELWHGHELVAMNQQTFAVLG
jgi:hypothetical protein